MRFGGQALADGLLALTALGGVVLALAALALWWRGDGTVALITSVVALSLLAPPLGVRWARRRRARDPR